MILASTGVGRLSLLLLRFDSLSRGGLSAVDLRIRSLTVEEEGLSSMSSARSGIVSVVGWRMLLPECPDPVERMLAVLPRRPIWYLVAGGSGGSSWLAVDNLRSSGF
jgi:hypothetical protein